MGVLSTCMSAPCVCLVFTETRSKCEIPWNWSELQMAVRSRCWKSNLGSLQEQQVFLIAEPSLEPCFLIFLGFGCYCRLLLIGSYCVVQAGLRLVATFLFLLPEC